MLNELIQTLRNL